MKNFLIALFKDTFSYISISIAVVILFIAYYLIFPGYWFLCSILTILIVAVFDIFIFSKRRKKD